MPPTGDCGGECCSWSFWKTDGFPAIQSDIPGQTGVGTGRNDGFIVTCDDPGFSGVHNGLRVHDRKQRVGIHPDRFEHPAIDPAKSRKSVEQLRPVRLCRNRLSSIQPAPTFLSRNRYGGPRVLPFDSCVMLPTIRMRRRLCSASFASLRFGPIAFPCGCALRPLRLRSSDRIITHVWSMTYMQNPKKRRNLGQSENYRPNSSRFIPGGRTVRTPVPGRERPASAADSGLR